MLAGLTEADTTRYLRSPPTLSDIASLRLEMRASFHELSERLKLLEMEQTQFANKFDALLSLVAETTPHRR